MASPVTPIQIIVNPWGDRAIRREGTSTCTTPQQVACLACQKEDETRLAFDGAWALQALQHGLYFSVGTSR